jgi:hypothetical protein
MGWKTILDKEWILNKLIISLVSKIISFK